MQTPEFKIGDIVTVDRYNHIDDVEICSIVAYGRMFISNTLTYKVMINGTEIETTGISIMESKHYEPVAENDRHEKLPKNFKNSLEYPK